MLRVTSSVLIKCAAQRGALAMPQAMSSSSAGQECGTALAKGIFAHLRFNLGWSAREIEELFLPEEGDMDIVIQSNDGTERPLQRFSRVTIERWTKCFSSSCQCLDTSYYFLTAHIVHVHNPFTLSRRSCTSAPRREVQDGDGVARGDGRHKGNGARPRIFTDEEARVLDKIVADHPCGYLVEIQWKLYQQTLSADKQVRQPFYHTPRNHQDSSCR